MTISPKEQAMLDAVAKQFGDDKTKWSGIEKRVFNKLSTEAGKTSEMTPDVMTAMAKEEIERAVNEAIRGTTKPSDLINDAIEGKTNDPGAEEPKKKKGGLLNKLKQEAERQIDRRIGQETRDIIPNGGRIVTVVENGVKKEIQTQLDDRNEKKIRSEIDTDALDKNVKEAYKNASQKQAEVTVPQQVTTTSSTTQKTTAAPTTEKPTVENMLVAAAGDDKILSKPELQKLLNDNKFLATANITQPTEVYVTNRTGDDTLAIGDDGAMVNLKTLGIKLADMKDPAKPDAAGFKPGATTMKTR